MDALFWFIAFRKASVFLETWNKISGHMFLPMKFISDALKYSIREESTERVLSKIIVCLMIYEHAIVNHILLQTLFNYRADFLGSIVVFFYCTYKYTIRSKINYNSLKFYLKKNNSKRINKNYANKHTCLILSRTNVKYLS